LIVTGAAHFTEQKLSTELPVECLHGATSSAQWELRQGNSLVLLKAVPSESIHLIVTDPPYFIDGMGDDWDNAALQVKAAKAGVIGSLPVGMKFDPAQGKNFQRFMEQVSLEAFRILKPGGFFISFSQARLYHRLGVAVEDAGFEIRDMLGWVYAGQAKAFSQEHFVRKNKALTASEKESIIQRLAGRKTPQLKPCIEPMTLAQKPRLGTFVENWLAYETGLVDTSQSLDGKFPGNLMQVPKPRKDEKGEGNTHLTVKPVALVEHLVRLFSKEGQTVLDPFAGSGSHGVAAVNAGRSFLGFELERMHVRTSASRLKECK
jgi:site-specific DNA-methyltransferase (adenine-specific)